VEELELSFAGLLRQLRNEARLTQEELAEAASVSPRSVSDLERGINRTAHRDTALLLAGALRLAGPVRDLFVAAARGRAPAAEVLAAREGATQHVVLRQQVVTLTPSVAHNLPAPLTSFLDREEALARLEKLLKEARLVTLEAEISSASWITRAKVLIAKAEVSRLTGAPDHAAATLRAALRIYEDPHVLLLAEQVKAMLASLTAPPGHESA
jgi:transcriptional regulator with XRE-family HTH domain